jgi:DNA-binding NtrC family response regulator
LSSDILIVDGERSRLDSLQDILETVGYGVTIADSAQKALNVVNPNTHKLVFINLYLPDLGGMDLLRELRPILPNASAVLLTETQDIIAEHEAKNLGVHRWLYLPVRPEEVIRCAAEVLEQASLADDTEEKTPSQDKRKSRDGSSHQTNSAR